MSCVRSFWAHEPVGGLRAGRRIAMRPGEARPGQRVGLLATDSNTRLEGFFIFEEGTEAVLATSFEPFREAHSEEGVPLVRPDGAPLDFFFISVSLANVLGRVPASWAEDFVPAVPAGRTPPTISQLMGAFDSQATAVPSEAEEAEQDASPSTPSGAAGASGTGTRRASSASLSGRRVGFTSAEQMPPPLPQAMAGAGLGHARPSASRLCTTKSPKKRRKAKASTRRPGRRRPVARR